MGECWLTDKSLLPSFLSGASRFGKCDVPYADGLPPLKNERSEFRGRAGERQKTDKRIFKDLSVNQGVSVKDKNDVMARPKPQQRR